jgi:tetratricopeptide (TPR) repeat protein
MKLLNGKMSTLKEPTSYLWVIFFALVTTLRIPQFKDTCTLMKTNLECSPKSAKLWYGTGVCFEWEKNYPKAAAAFKKTLELYPDYQNAAIQFSQTLENMGLAGEAISVLSIYTSEHPGHYKARFFYAMVLARQGQLRKAAQVLKGLLDTPWSAQARRYLGYLRNRYEK